MKKYSIKNLLLTKSFKICKIFVILVIIHFKLMNNKTIIHKKNIYTQYLSINILKCIKLKE